MKFYDKIRELLEKYYPDDYYISNSTKGNLINYLKEYDDDKLNDLIYLYLDDDKLKNKSKDEKIKLLDNAIKENFNKIFYKLSFFNVISFDKMINNKEIDSFGHQYVLLGLVFLSKNDEVSIPLDIKKMYEEKFGLEDKKKLFIEEVKKLGHVLFMNFAIVKESILLSFYDELIAHKIPITLTNLLKFCEIDTYDEYANQLEFLAEIYSEYQILLESNELRDSLYSHTIKQNYEISTQFLESFSAVYIELEGFITPLQYEILEQAAKSVAIFLYFTTDLYNISNFTILQQPLEIHRKYIYGIHNKKLLCIKDTLVDVNAINLYKTQKSFNQANLAIFLAYKWQQQILNNEASENDFALILPNESFCNHLITLDSGNLFNFAMGISVTSLEEYIVLEKIYMYFLEYKIFCIEALMQYIQSSTPIKQTGHLDIVLSMCLPDSYIIENPQLEQLEDILHILFESYTTLLTQGITILAELKLVAQKSFFSIRELNFEQLFILFMRDFSTLKKDDIHGGKIRVMGTLEARNLSFKEVLILDFTDDYIPNVTHEDVFLNSKIRSFYGMPTRQDKENIYKHHYYNIIKNSQIAHICYVVNHEKMPSNMLLELHCNLEDSQNIDQH